MRMQKAITDLHFSRIASTLQYSMPKAWLLMPKNIGTPCRQHLTWRTRTARGARRWGKPRRGPATKSSTATEAAAGAETSGATAAKTSADAATKPCAAAAAAEGGRRGCRPGAKGADALTERRGRRQRRREPSGLGRLQRRAAQRRRAGGLQHRLPS